MTEEELAPGYRSQVDVDRLRILELAGNEAPAVPGPSHDELLELVSHGGSSAAPVA